MQYGGKKFEKTEKTKYKKNRESWDSWGDGPQKLKEFKKRHHDKSTYRLLKNEKRDYE
jgi:hypothetical protein